MNFLNQIWIALSGKKTIIGSVFLTLSAFSSQVVINIWGVDVAWLPKAIDTFDWIGMILGGTGLLHKGAKAMVAPTEPKP